MRRTVSKTVLRLDTNKDKTYDRRTKFSKKMKPTIDLFHQLIYEADGYQAILIVDDEPWPCVKVYQPDGRCCGGTNAQNHYTRLAAIRETIKINKQWRRAN